MKLELEIPKWAEDKNIFVFANQELIAYKMHNELKLKVKVSRCLGCGACCESGHPFKPEQLLTIKKAIAKGFNSDGPCPFLGEEGCLLGNNIPFSCARSDCSQHFDKCTERFE